MSIEKVMVSTIVLCVHYNVSLLFRASFGGFDIGLTLIGIKKQC